MSRLLPWVYLTVLALINLIISKESFGLQYSAEFHSAHGLWITLAKQPFINWLIPTWFADWGAGTPLEYTYAPLVPWLIRAWALVLGCTPEVAYHAIAALVYCAGPLTLYVFTWRVLRYPGYGFVAGLAYSLISPVELIVPDAGWSLARLLYARRMYVAFVWDDVPHLFALSLLPVLVWLLSRAVKTGRVQEIAAAAGCMVAMMLGSMFGVVLSALAVLTVPLAMNSRFERFVLLRVGIPLVAAVVIVSPWISPGLLQIIRSNSEFNHEISASWQSTVAWVGVGLTMLAVWRIGHRLTEQWPVRWIALFAVPVVAAPILFQYAGVQILQQSGRYKCEMELVLVWLGVMVLATLVERAPVAVRVVLLAGLLGVAVRQIGAYRSFANDVLHPIAVQETIDYKTAKWMESNFSGQRVLLGGSPANWLNVFTNMPQLAGQPYTTALNQMQVLALYIYFRGETGGEPSLVWLKAFGVNATSVSGPKSTEYWKPFVQPLKFEGLLPLMWRESDYSIYRIPLKSASLAHVVEAGSVVQRRPIHGLDLAEVTRYVSALDNESGVAGFRWEGANRAVIEATMSAGDLISAQINYHRGWRAYVSGEERRVRADGIGLMVVEANCRGQCEVRLEYDGGAELKLCRVASACMVIGLVVALVWRREAAGK